MSAYSLRPGEMTLAELRAAWTAPMVAELPEDAWQRVRRAHQTVQQIVAANRTVYGINTGFGLLANTRIEADELDHLQRNLVLSHSAGVGPDLPDEVMRLVLVLKVSSLAQGYSGVSEKTLRALLTLLNQSAYPCVPAKGSVGASGDLAPLAHLSASLLGEGRMRIQGRTMAATEALAEIGLEPLQLGPKEGLALLNGTQVSTALALSGLFRCEQVFAAALCAGALSVDAAQGSDVPFDRRIHEIRRQPGQIRIAAWLSEQLSGSQIRASHVDCERIQDPYCLRCQPQVMGAILDLMDDAARRLLLESDAVTDNPLVFCDTNEAISGGNFHAEPVAFAADMLALALAEIGNMSERRLAMLVDPAMSGLPAFLVENSGLNSGFMIAQVTAAALASENKQRAHPASVDSIPTSANQEDHVSMATHAAYRLAEMADNCAAIVAIEALAASQGIEFHRPHRSSDRLEDIVSELRQQVPRYQEDRYFAPDIEAAARWVYSAQPYERCAGLLPSRSDTGSESND